MDNWDKDLSDLELQIVNGGKLEDHEDSWKKIIRKMKNDGWSYDRVMKFCEPHMSGPESRELFTRWIKDVFAG